MDLKRSKLIDHRMSSIIPAIKARHIIRALRQIIHNFSFTLITPLRPDHCCNAHKVSVSLCHCKEDVLPDEAIPSLLLEIASGETLAMTPSVNWIARPIYESGESLLSLARVSSSTSSASTQDLKSASVKTRPRV